MKLLILSVVVVCLLATASAQTPDERGGNCPNACSGHGFCSNGQCLCSPGFSGEDCSTPLGCRNGCNNNGECRNGICFCKAGWEGEDCAQEKPNGCKHGDFSNQIRELLEYSVRGYYKRFLNREPIQAALDAWVNSIMNGKETLTTVEEKVKKSFHIRCPNDCSLQGECVIGQCECYAGFEGVDCSIKRGQCPNACSQHGKCYDSACTCDEGWEGDDCSEPICPNACSQHGKCVDGACQCEAGYLGDDCSTEPNACPNACSEHGICQPDATCKCDEFYTGADCSELVKSTLAFRGDDFTITEPFRAFPSTELTFECWYRSSNKNVTHQTIASYANSQGDNALVIYNTDDLRLLLVSGGTKPAGVSINDGEWHHLAMTWRSRDGRFELYKDSEIAFTSQYNQGLELEDGGMFVLGQEQDCLGGCFTKSQALWGDLTEVRLWSHVRTEDQIKDNARVKLSGEEPGLAVYYPFTRNADDARKVADKTVNANHSVLGNEDTETWPQWVSDRP